MSVATAASNSTKATPMFRRLLRLAGKGLRRLDTWIERGRQRRILAELTDDQLRDIGLSRDEASRQARMPFWKP